MIFRKGDPSDRFYIVKEGQALITDGEKFLEIIRPGCCFGACFFPNVFNC